MVLIGPGYVRGRCSHLSHCSRSAVGARLKFNPLIWSISCCQVSPVHSAGSPPRVNEAGIRDGSPSVDTACRKRLKRIKKESSWNFLEDSSCLFGVLSTVVNIYFNFNMTLCLSHPFALPYDILRLRFLKLWLRWAPRQCAVQPWRMRWGSTGNGCGFLCARIITYICIHSSLFLMENIAIFLSSLVS